MLSNYFSKHRDSNLNYSKVHNHIEIKVRTEKKVHSSSNSRLSFLCVLNLFLFFYYFIAPSLLPLFSAFLWSVSCLYISCHLFPFYLNWSPFHFHSVTVVTLVPWVKCICGLHLCKHYTHWIQANTLLKIL